MKIISLESILVDLPTIRAHKLARQTVMQQTLVVLRLRTDAGLEGLGEATTIGGLSYGEESPEIIKSALDTYISPIVIGMDPRNVNAVMAEIERHVVGNRLAKSGLETALHDVSGKALGVPVHQLLGGRQTAAMECIWGLASGDTAKDIEEAERVLSQKLHRGFKIKVGSKAVENDIEHVSKIAKAIAGRGTLRIDANQAWDELTATRAIAALEAVGVSLIEQPLPKANHEGMVRLASRFDVAIMADEAVATPQDAFMFGKHHGADVVALKIAKAGGLLPTKSVAAISQAGGLALYGGTMLEGTIGTIASLHAFASLPQNFPFGTELFGPLLLKDDIVQQRPNYSNFAIAVPDRPGLGVDIDEEKLAHYRRDKTRSLKPVAALKQGSA
ncbi:MAG: muconate/chloromuconate family cycloisomerase [Alphaproteobacteria bacterium]|nr:muconate/chloromuconate family cycloisomerase [Alphaproteobacteria bacterium]